MGIFELLMDRAHDTEVAYMRTLSRAKQRAAAWFNHGRALRSLPLRLNVTTATTRDAHPRSGRDASLVH